MRASDLLSPGVLSNGQSLRHESAHAISRGEINIGRNNATTLTALAAYFTDAAARCNEVIADATPTAATSTAVAVPDAAAAGALSTFTFTLLNDESGPVARVPVTVVRTGTATGGTVSALTGFTNGAGEFVVTVTGTIAGTVILTASVDWLGASFTEAATCTYS